MGGGVSTHAAPGYDRTAASAAPHLSARDAKGLIFSALRAGLSDTAKLTKPEALRQISQYRATLRKWLVDASPLQKAANSTTTSIEVGATRLPAELAEELLESNWRARAVEQAYAQHMRRTSNPSEIIVFVLEFCTVREWIECAAVCRAWFDAVCTDDVLWSGFLADICAPTLVAQDFQLCRSLAAPPVELSEHRELPTMMLLAGPVGNASAELEASQHDDTEREKQIWDSLANRELISAHLSVMPEVLPPSEFSTGINRNVVKADSWKWGKMIGWVSFFEVASRFITLVPGRVSLWASDPDCLQLSINKNVSFSELRRLQTGKDEQLVSFDVETGELLVIGPADASAQRKLRYRQEHEDDEDEVEENEEDDDSGSEDRGRNNCRGQPTPSPRKSFLARAFSLSAGATESEIVGNFARNLAVKAGCYRPRVRDAPDFVTLQYPTTRSAFTTLLLGRIGRVLLGHATEFDLESGSTVGSIESAFLARFPSAASHYSSLPRQGHRRTQYTNSLWTITTKEFAICFDIQRAELHLEKHEDPVCLWNEFHLRRTRLGMAPMKITEDLARELVKHFLAPQGRINFNVITTEIANRRWQTLLFLHWVYCSESKKVQPEEEEEDSIDDSGNCDKKRNTVCNYVNEGLCEKARGYLRKRVSQLLGTYVVDFQQRNRPESDCVSTLQQEAKCNDERKEKSITSLSLEDRGDRPSLTMKIVVEEDDDHFNDDNAGSKIQDNIESTEIGFGESSALSLNAHNLREYHDGGGSNISAPGSIVAPGNRSWLEGPGQDNFAVPSPRESEVLGITSARD
eukprot:g5345.t1